MRKFLWAWAILFLWAPALQAVPPAGPERNFTARDLFDLEAASDPQISPDGRWIAYVRRSGDIMTDRFRRSIWLIDTNSGAQGSHKLARGYEPTPTWSAHFLPDPRFRDAVASYLEAERRAVVREIAALDEMTPFRKG